jgi:hypothetical protein
MSDQTLGRAVLAYDELLRHPQFNEIAAYLREQVREQDPRGIGHLDQTDAAAREVHDRLMQVIQAGEMFTTNLPTAAHPDWLRLGLSAALMTWLAGKSDTCRHNPTWQNPQPTFAVAWKPRLVFCGQCLHLTRLPPGSEADRTCDGCGTITDKTTGPGIWQVGIAHGAFVYLAGVCADCRYWQESA